MKLNTMLIAFVLILCAIAVPAQTPAVKSVPLPQVSAQITGPGPMFPGLREVPRGTEIADFDYEAKEYFVSGTASGKPYTTRIIVRQPKNPKKFSGVVVSEAMHGSGNSWMFYFTRIYMMNQGHIHVEIAAQKAPTEASIIKANPARYQPLSIPDAGQVNEILAQVGELIKSNMKNGPFTGFQVRRSVLMGTSQSSAVLRTYLGFHSTYRMPDGSPIFDGYFPTSTAGAAQIPPIDVPLIQVATQTEVTADAATGNKYRRPDGDEKGNQFRLYEMAGMPHNDSRENPTYRPDDPCALPVTRFPDGALFAMGLDHLIQWADRGVAPPRADRVLVDGDAKNDGSLLALDEYGNAKGGVRNTYVDVPVAKYGVPNTGKPGLAPEIRADFYCNIAGYEQPLSHEKLQSLYKDHKEYQKKVADRLKQLEKAGWFLPVYEKQVEGDAAAALVP